MNRLKIGVKIGLGFGLVILTMAALVAVVTFYVNQADRAVGKLNNIEMPIVKLSHEYDADTLEILVDRAYFLLDNNDTDSLNKALNLFTPMTATMLDRGKELLKVAPPETNPKFNAMMNGLEGKINHWKDILGNVVKTARERQDIVTRLNNAGVEFMQAGLEYIDIIDDIFGRQIESGAKEEQQRALYQTVLMRDLMLRFSDIESAIYRAQYYNDAQALKEIAQDFDYIDMVIKNLLPLTRIAGNQERLNKLLGLSEQYRTLLLNCSEVIDRSNDLLAQCKATSGDLRNMFQDASNAAFAHMESAANDTASQITVSQLMMMIGFGVALVLSILIALAITRTIVRPVKVTSNAISTMADGDFTASIDPAMLRRRDEMGEMLTDVQRMSENLSRTITSIINDSNTVANAAGEISQGNQQLSEQTQQQAGAIEETASALEQMTSSVKNNAASAEQANQLARKTSQIAQDGGKSVERTVEAMKEVAASSKKINDIINVVNEIAFQTNLLALNAAVEAARAGEAGRGFAVVAGEVRNLAGRSAQAAKEIQNLITDSVLKVEHGNNLVAESGEILGNIINNVQHVADTINEITSASQEQASGIEEVSKAVNQMDEAVQQNAAFVEQAASSSETMASVANNMRAQMAQFKVRDITGTPTRSLPAPSSAPLVEPKESKKEAKAAAKAAKVGAKVAAKSAPAPAPRPAAPRPAAPAAPRPAAPVAEPKPAAPAPAAAKPAAAALKSAEKDDFFGVSELDGFEEF